ncbi:hypothetical protein ACMZ49_22880, partial [Alcaligenes phenolicus]
PDAWLEIARRVPILSFTFEPLPCRMYWLFVRSISIPTRDHVIIVSQSTVMLSIGLRSASCPNASSMKQVYRPGLECFFKTIRLRCPFWNSIPRFPPRR